MIITTNQLLIRAFQSNDTEAVYQIGSNPELTQPLNMTAFQSDAEAQRFLQMLQTDPDAWALTLKTTQEVCGVVMLAPNLAADQVSVAGYELSFALLPAFQKHGLMSTALPAIMQHYQQTQAVTVFNAACFLDNRDSQKLLLKLGFQADYQTQLPAYLGGQTVQYFRYLII